MELFGDCGAADDIAALEHPDPETSRREIAGAGEAVVAATDDDGVVAG
jgi:hypothetical protein